MRKGFMKRHAALVMAGVMVMAGALTGCGSTKETKTDETKKEETSAETKTETKAADSDTNTEDAGTLVLYASTPEEFLKVVTEEFEAATGVKVEVVTAGTGELYNRIQAEGDNPLGDVMMGGMVSSGYVPNKELWEDYVSVNDQDLPEEYRNTTGNVTGFSLVPSALMINSDIAGDIEINGYEDLLNPELKGKIVMPDPTATSSGWEQLVNILYAMGGGDTDEAWDYVDKLLANIDGKVLTSSGSVHKGVADGEYAVGLIAESMADTYIMEGMTNISKTFMEEGVVVNLDGVAIIKGAKNMDNAKKFIDFMTSKEFQQKMAECTPPRRPVRDDVTIPEGSGLAPSSEIKQIEVDYDYIAEHKAEIQEKFQEIAMEYAQ